MNGNHVNPMMTLTADKKQFFKLFLVFYFLVYSVSPLTYTLSDKPVPESSYATTKKSSNIKSVHILLWEFFTKRPSSPEETSHNNGNASILIKEKRAIAPENASEKISLFKNMSVPEGFYNPLAPATYINVLPENIPGIDKGFNPLYAGNSPPSV
jgi:hypothetical protein